MKLIKSLTFVIFIFSLFGCTTSSDDVQEYTESDIAFEAKGLVTEVNGNEIKVLSETEDINGEVLLTITGRTKFDDDVRTEFKKNNIVRISVAEFNDATMKAEAAIVTDNTTFEEYENSWPNSDSTLDELDGVWIETEYETYKEGTNAVRVKWFNTLDDLIMYGEHFTLEKKVNDDWKVVKKDTDFNYGFVDIGYLLLPNDERWITYDFFAQWYNTGLTKGNYRINASFIRQTLNGESYGAGNYPEYQVYTSFNVGNENVIRDMTSLNNDKIEYKNPAYGFSINLTKDWNDLSVFIEEQNESLESHDLYKDIDNEYEIIKLRHPKWTFDEPYQDIVLIVFRNKEWNDNVTAATNGDFDLLPERVFSGRYILAIDPEYYNDDYIGYNEVLDILSNSVNRY